MPTIDPKLAAWAGPLLAPVGGALAGGAVVDLQKAGDVDLWGPEKEGAALWEAVSRQASRIERTEQEPIPGYPQGRWIRYFGRAFVPALGKSVEVIGTHHRPAADVIYTFDLSVHAWAWTQAGGISWVEGWSTGLGEPIQLGTVWDSSRTLARYIKLSARYGCPAGQGLFWQLLERAKEEARTAGVEEQVF